MFAPYWKRRAVFGQLVLLFSLVAGCSTSEKKPLPARPEPLASENPKPEASAARAAPSGSASTPAASSSSPPAEKPPAPAKPPALVDKDGKPLPQTNAGPSLESAHAKRGVQKLFEAIAKDDPELARFFFFPVSAYEQVKAIKKPAADWNWRLWGHFKRDVHRYHKQLGKSPESCKLLGITPNKRRRKWMKPHTEGNLLGYYRMLHSKLEVQCEGKKPQRLDITSFISWRGEWYIVHLNGFK